MISLHYPCFGRLGSGSPEALPWFQLLNLIISYPCRRYGLVSIRKVEKKDDHNKGVRYFIDVVVSDVITGEQYILADYVYKPNGDKTPLCYPEGLQWNTVADVYLILTAKNLGRWVHNFIKNVEKIVEETKDEHLHVVIYDFDSPDIDLRHAFQRSALKKYHFIRKPGKYSRTISFTEAIDSIKDPNAIVVTIDLHLDLGSQFINEIRKVSVDHTLIKGASECAIEVSDPLLDVLWVKTTPHRRNP